MVSVMHCSDLPFFDLKPPHIVTSFDAAIQGDNVESLRYLIKGLFDGADDLEDGYWNCSRPGCGVRLGKQLDPTHDPLPCSVHSAPDLRSQLELDSRWAQTLAVKSALSGELYPGQFQRRQRRNAAIKSHTGEVIGPDLSFLFSRGASCAVPTKPIESQ